MSNRQQIIIKAMNQAISAIHSISDDEYDLILDNGGRPAEAMESLKIIVSTLQM